MTLDTLFLLVIAVYLVLIAYGTVGARRRGAPRGTRIAAMGLTILVPPLALLVALWSTDDPALFRAWAGMLAGMAVGGLVVAIAAEAIARRVMP